MRAQTTVSVDRTTINRKLVEASDLKVRVIANEAGRDMARRATELMSRDFDLSRPYERRRHPGSRRSATAISHETKRLGPARYQVTYKILGGAVVEARIAGLNYGIGGGHVIRPSGNWPLRGVRAQGLGRARMGGGVRRSSKPLLAWVDERTGEDVVTGWVQHPGMVRFPKGSGFLERARDEVVASLSRR
jgi:hypothetical protein